MRPVHDLQEAFWVQLFWRHPAEPFLLRRQISIEAFPCIETDLFHPPIVSQRPQTLYYKTARRKKWLIETVLYLLYDPYSIADIPVHIYYFKRLRKSLLPPLQRFLHMSTVAIITNKIPPCSKVGKGFKQTAISSHIMMGGIYKN